MIVLVDYTLTEHSPTMLASLSSTKISLTPLWLRGIVQHHVSVLLEYFTSSINSICQLLDSSLKFKSIPSYVLQGCINYKCWRN